MKNMTAKEFVKQHYPNARAELQVQGRIKGMQTSYWLVRNGRETMYMASGTSESNAWVNAKEVVKRKLEALQFKFKVNIWEYERGWGSKIDEVKLFDTYDAAEEFITEFNGKNTAKEVPDWYMVADRANYSKQS